jgi:hypothetical protein
MKRLIGALAFSVALLVVSITAAVAMAAPAPKTTGGIGYTAYSDVQRHLEFVAIQSTTNTCGTFWNVTGVSQFTFRLTSDTTDYTHHVVLTQNGQTVGGSGGYPLTGGDAYHWNITAGSLIGNALSLTAVYDLGAPGTTMHMTGTIASNGSISGTWDDNFGGARTGTFTAPAGSAAATVSYCGKGNAYYSDASGLWYLVNVTTVSVLDQTAWFAGPVIASNFGAEGNWLFAKVFDGGEPGKLVDQASGSFTNEVTATSGVAGHLAPVDGPFTITSGNLQVH